MVSSLSLLVKEKGREAPNYAWDGASLDCEGIAGSSCGLSFAFYGNSTYGLELPVSAL